MAKIIAWPLFYQREINREGWSLFSSHFFFVGVQFLLQST